MGVARHEKQPNAAVWPSRPLWLLIENAGQFGWTSSQVEKEWPVTGQTGRINDKEHTQWVTQM